MKINLNKKSFVLLENSKTGTVDRGTIFKYQQVGNLVTADYEGGQIRCGKIIGKLAGTKMKIIYQCMTVEGELKAGHAIASISATKENKLRMDLNWEWLGEHSGKGTSSYVESN